MGLFSRNKKAVDKKKKRNPGDSDSTYELEEVDDFGIDNNSSSLGSDDILSSGSNFEEELTKLMGGSGSTGKRTSDRQINVIKINGTTDLRVNAEMFENIADAPNPQARVDALHSLLEVYYYGGFNPYRDAVIEDVEIDGSAWGEPSGTYSLTFNSSHEEDSSRNVLRAVDIKSINYIEEQTFVAKQEEIVSQSDDQAKATARASSSSTEVLEKTQKIAYETSSNSARIALQNIVDNEQIKTNNLRSAGIAVYSRIDERQSEPLTLEEAKRLGFVTFAPDFSRFQYNYSHGTLLKDGELEVQIVVSDKEDDRISGIPLPIPVKVAFVTQIILEAEQKKINKLKSNGLNVRGPIPALENAVFDVNRATVFGFNDFNPDPRFNYTISHQEMKKDGNMPVWIAVTFKALPTASAKVAAIKVRVKGTTLSSEETIWPSQKEEPTPLAEVQKHSVDESDKTTEVSKITEKVEINKVGEWTADRYEEFDESKVVQQEVSDKAGVSDQEFAGIGADLQNLIKSIKSPVARSNYRTFNWLLVNDRFNNKSVFYDFRELVVLEDSIYDFKVILGNGKEIFVKVVTFNNIIGNVAAGQEVKQFNVKLSEENFLISDDYYASTRAEREQQEGMLSYDFLKNFNDQYIGDLKQNLVHLPSKMGLQHGEADLDKKYGLKTGLLINALARALKDVYSARMLLPNVRADNSVLVLIDESSNGFFYLNRNNVFAGLTPEILENWTIESYFLAILEFAIKEVGYHDFFEEMQFYFHEAASDYTQERYYPVSTLQDRPTEVVESAANHLVWVEPLVDRHPLLNGGKDIFKEPTSNNFTDMYRYFEAEDNLTRMIASLDNEGDEGEEAEMMTK